MSVPSSWALAETLLINEQPVEAIVALLDFSPERAAALLRQRQQVGRLLELAKVKDDTTFNATWLASLPASSGDAKLQARGRFAVAGQAALVLRDLGRKAAVDEIVDTLEAAAVSDADDGRRWSALAKLRWQLGRYDDALKAAALAAGFLPPSQVFAEFIKPQAALAAFWFGSAKDIDPLVDREKACIEAVWMSVPRRPPARPSPIGKSEWMPPRRTSASWSRRCGPRTSR